MIKITAWMEMCRETVCSVPASCFLIPLPLHVYLQYVVNLMKPATGPFPTALDLTKDLSNNRPFHIMSPLASLPQLVPLLLPANPSSFWPHPFSPHLTPSLTLSISFNTSFSSFLPSPSHPPSLVSEAVWCMMKCTYWETLVPIFISFYLPRLQCQCY